MNGQMRIFVLSLSTIIGRSLTMTKFIAFDTETSKPINNINLWKNERPLGIGCGCTISSGQETKIWHGEVQSDGRYSCPDRGVSGELASIKFLSAVVGQRVNPTSLKWVNNQQPEDELCYAWNRLKMKLMKATETLNFQIPTTNIQEATSSIGRAILGVYSCGDNTEFKALSKLLSSDKKVIDACAKVIAEDFDLADRKSLDDI